MRELHLTNNFERLAEKIYLWLKANKAFFGIAIGYLGSTIIQILDMFYEGSTVSEVISKYDNFKPTTIIILFSVLIIIFYFIGEKSLKKYLDSKTLNNNFHKLLVPYKSKLFANHLMEGYGWGDNQTFVAIPDVQEGLVTKDISFEISSGCFNWRELKRFDETFMDRDLEKEYKDYMENEFYKNFTYDSDRLMLTKKPSIYTDDNKMRICLKKIKWSQLQFYWNKLLNDNEQKMRYIKKYYDGEDIQSPNSFCLHLVVLTEDNKMLLVKNSSNKFTDYPNHWTASLGEQIDKEDLKNLEEDCAYKWVVRALQEELALAEEDINKNNIKYLSVNLEGDVCNFTFMCLAVINRTSEELISHLNIETRPDNEFDSIEFLNIEDIPKELVSPSKKYHPSSQLRMFYTYVNQKGRANIRREILKATDPSNT